MVLNSICLFSNKQIKFREMFSVQKNYTGSFRAMGNHHKLSINILFSVQIEN